MIGCPVTLHCTAQYGKYEDAAERVYRILLRQTAAVQMLSCDEAFMDVTGLGDPEQIAAAVRSQASGPLAVKTPIWRVARSRWRCPRPRRPSSSDCLNAALQE